MNAYCLIRPQPVYRRDAFVQGLAAAGLNVCTNLPRRPGVEDVLVIWNRYGEHDGLARRFEAAGARVLVAENGYLGYGGRSHRPHDLGGRRMYALALHDHGGRGRWPHPAGASRFARLEVEVKPRRASGSKVLVCAQRGIGSPGRGSPPGWADQVAREIRAAFGVPVVVRPHPGDGAPAIPLEQDLSTALACVIWASGCGVKALVEGVPVFYACPWWVCAGGARRYQGPASLRSPVHDDLARAQALERMAWAQWTVDELASGEPFRLLLSLPADEIDPLPVVREVA